MDDSTRSINIGGGLALLIAGAVLDQMGTGFQIAAGLLACGFLYVGFTGRVPWVLRRLFSASAPSRPVVLDFAENDMSPAGVASYARGYEELPSGIATYFAAFDASAETRAELSRTFQSHQSHHRLRARIQWAHEELPASKNSGVVFGIRGPTSIDRRFQDGGGAVIADFGGIPNRLYWTGWVDLPNLPALSIDDVMAFQLYRAVAHPQDTLAIDAKVYRVQLEVRP